MSRAIAKRRSAAPAARTSKASWSPRRAASTRSRCTDRSACRRGHGDRASTLHDGRRAATVQGSFDRLARVSRLVRLGTGPPKAVFGTTEAFPRQAHDRTIGSMDRRVPRRLWLAAPALLLAVGLLLPAAVDGATDSDHDTLPNTWEVQVSKTNPYKAD